MHLQQRLEIEVDLVADRIHSVSLFCDTQKVAQPEAPQESAGRALLELAESFPDTIVCWFDRRVSAQLSRRETWTQLLRHPLEIRFYPGPADDAWRMASMGFAGHYSALLMPMGNQCITPAVLISPLAGVCQAEILASFSACEKSGRLSHILSDIGRLSMSHAICAYADSRLLDGNATDAEVRSLVDSRWCEISKLVVSQFGRRKLLPWLLGLLLAKKQFPLFSALLALRKRPELVVDEERLLQLRLNLPDVEVTEHVEVVIPTLERPDHLLRILDDLANQDTLPVCIHVVAQGEGSVPPVIAERKWPFEVSVYQVPWVGVCRARNLGIRKTTAKWVLLADDDVRLPTNYVTQMLSLAIRFKVEAVNAIPDDTQIVGISPDARVWAWRHFLSGFALCTRDVLLTTGGFQERMEGIIFEDFELGVRIRQTGTHTMVTRELAVINEAAPTGGFRSDKIVRNGPVDQPGLVIYSSLLPFMTKAMRLGYRIQHSLAILRSRRWWQWPGQIVKLKAAWRNTDRWYRTRDVTGQSDK